jgi:hypothetical protein
MAKPSNPAAVSETLPMSVANMTFMVDRLGEDCAPLQFLRELTQNSIHAIQSLPDQKGDIVWDVDWNRFILTGQFKVCVIDTGIGMSGEEMVNYINKLSSSMHQQSATGNFGVGAKIAAAPRNHAGLVYLSWKGGVGHMVHLWRDPDSNVYGLRKFERPDGTFGHWAYVEDDIKPAPISDHGTMVILLGNDVEQNTMQAPADTPMPSRWILRYLNSRYYEFPPGVTIKAREGWELPQGDKHNFLRTVSGQRPWLDSNSSSRGSVKLKGANGHWWILRADVDQDAGHLVPGGHMAALYQNELYELLYGRAGVSRLQAFGVIFGHSRVVIYVEPTAGRNHLVANTSRTNLLLDGEPLPWAEWAASFREHLPDELAELMNEVAASSPANDHKQAIRERLRQIRDLFKLSRYRPAPGGDVLIDEDRLVGGGKARDTESSRGSGSGASGGRGGRAGDIYGLFLTARGIPGEEFSFDRDPEVRWVSMAEGTRTPPDLEDRAAKFLPEQNLLLINADFRVFVDMIERWARRYAQVPAARAAVEQVVREWFEQQLIETVLGSQSLKDSRYWTVQDLERVWSEEALTAAVMPRYHVEMSARRALGAKLGSLKDHAA